MILGMTDPMTNPVKHRMYLEYVERCLPGVTVRILSYQNARPEEIGECDGVLLTGGVDVDPSFYGREDARPLAEEPNPERDGFEIPLVREAVRSGKPVLGICRGMQICNVALGGTLIPDLETAGFRRHTTRSGEDQRQHPVEIEPGTLLRGMTGLVAGSVSTYHHQAVDRVAPGLRVAARSEDGVVEALEWERPEGRPFLLLVQWHPERMEVADPLAKDLLERLGRAMRTPGG